MKTLLTLIGASAITALSAQTITSADAPTVGYPVSWQTSEWYGPLATGSGQSWDMSAATPSGNAEVFYYISPSMAPGAAAFPDADIALQPAEDLNTATFFDVQPDGLHWLGTFDSGGPVTVIFADADNIMRYPCSLGTTWTDDNAYETSVDGNPISTGSGTSTYTADGTGTLILPSGTYTDVIRITHTASDTSVAFGTTNLTTKDEVIFRKSGIQEVLASTVHHTYFENGVQTGELFLSYYMTALGTGTPELDANIAAITLFPNPANTAVSIRANTSAAAEMTVTDAMGRVLYSSGRTSAFMKSGTMTLDVSNWARGIYQVILLDDRGYQSVERLVVN